MDRVSDALLSFAIDLEPFDCPHAVPLRYVQTIVNREVPSLNWYNYSNCTKLFSMDYGPVSSLSVTPVANGGREPLKICQVGDGERRREGGRKVSIDAFRPLLQRFGLRRFSRISSQCIFPTLISPLPFILPFIAFSSLDPPQPQFLSLNRA